MPGQIPKALGVLNQFLSAENARLELEIKQDDIQKTIDQATSEFMGIGAEDSMQDVRDSYFKAVQLATQNDATETIPFITQMFSQSAQFVREEKLGRQEEATVEALGEHLGRDFTGLGGAGAGKLAGLDVQTRKFVEQEDEFGKSTLRQFRMEGGKIKPTDDVIPIRSSTFRTRAAFQPGNRAPNQQQTMYQVRSVDGKMSPAIFDPSSGTYRKWDPFSQSMQPLGAGDELSVRESAPSAVRQRNAKDAKLQYETSLELMKGHVTDLAKDLKDAGYPITISDFQNLVSFKAKPEAYRKLISEADQIAQFIGEMSPGEKRDQLERKYTGFAQQSQFFTQAADELQRWTQQSPFREEEGVRNPDRQPAATTLEKIDEVMQSGPDGDRPEEYRDLDAIVRANFVNDRGNSYMPLSVFRIKLRNNELTSDEEEIWRKILLKLEENPQEELR